MFALGIIVSPCSFSFGNLDSIQGSSVSSAFLLSTSMCLSFFLVGLLLLLLCHDILEHGPQPFDLAELIADLLITHASVYVFRICSAVCQ